MKRIIITLLVLMVGLMALPAQAIYIMKFVEIEVQDALDTTTPEGMTGVLYRAGDPDDPDNPTGIVTSNFLSIDAGQLPGGYDKNAPPAERTVKMEVRANPAGYFAGPSVAATLSGYALETITPPIQLDSWYNVVGGPQLFLTCYLQGYYGPADPDPDPVAYVVVRAYDAVDLPDMLGGNGALAAVAIIMLVDGVGNNGFLQYPAYANTLTPNTEYFLIIDHWIPGLDPGPNHMPVMTSSKVQFDMIGANLNLTVDPYSKIYRTSDTDPVYMHAMFEEPDGTFSLKGGFLTGYAGLGEGDIGGGDAQVLSNVANYELLVIEQNADPRGDFNGDNFVGGGDAQIISNERNWQTQTSVPYYPMPPLP
jgi:hypothetical protein